MGFHPCRLMGWKVRELTYPDLSPALFSSRMFSMKKRDRLGNIRPRELGISTLGKRASHRPDNRKLLPGSGVAPVGGRANLASTTHVGPAPQCCCSDRPSSLDGAEGKRKGSSRRALWLRWHQHEAWGSLRCYDPEPYGHHTRGAGPGSQQGPHTPCSSGPSRDKDHRPLPCGHTGP